MNSKKNVTAQDVANLAGVSRAAVSRALSKNGSIAPDTKTKVLAAAEALGYQVNFLAQGLNRKRSQLIGVVVTRISDPFRSSLLEGLISVIQDRGYQAMVTEIRSEQELEDTMRRFTQFRVSGVVVTSGQPPAALVAECVQYKIPVVGINRQQNIPFVDFVCSNNQQGATLVAQHFQEHQLTSLGWLNYKGSTWSGVRRGEAFIEAITKDAATVMFIEADHDGYQGGFDTAHKIDLKRLPKGIFSANAQLACGFLDGMRNRGLDAPQDFHLIGFDNTPQTAQFSYQLTTLHQDIFALCHNTLDCLESRSIKPNLPARVIETPVSMVIRNSSPSPLDENLSINQQGRIS